MLSTFHIYTAYLDKKCGVCGVGVGVWVQVHVCLCLYNSMTQINFPCDLLEIFQLLLLLGA